MAGTVTARAGAGAEAEAEAGAGAGAGAEAGATAGEVSGAGRATRRQSSLEQTRLPPRKGRKTRSSCAEPLRCSFLFRIPLSLDSPRPGRSASSSPASSLPAISSFLSYSYFIGALR